MKRIMIIIAMLVSLLTLAGGTAQAAGGGNRPAGAYQAHPDVCEGFGIGWAIHQIRREPADLMGGLVVLTANPNCLVASVFNTVELQFNPDRADHDGSWITVDAGGYQITDPAGGETFPFPVGAVCNGYFSGTHHWRLHDFGAGEFPDGTPTATDLYLPDKDNGARRTCYSHQACPKGAGEDYVLKPGLSKTVMKRPPEALMTARMKVTPLRCPPALGTVHFLLQRRISGSWVTQKPGSVSLDLLFPNGPSRSASVDARCTPGLWREAFYVRGRHWSGKEFITKLGYYPTGNGVKVKSC